ncbi:hypothetical protein Q7P37_004146 [Cladosporium fusiforme]
MPPRINLPPITRALLLTLLSLSALNAALRFRSWNSSTPDNDTTAPSIYLTSPRWAIPYLVLVPTKSIIFPWTFLTSALIENNIVSLLISSAVVYFGGKYLERAWGGQEFIKFTLFVTMIPNILTFFIYAVWHALTSHTPEHPTPINGLLALSAAFLVSLKQLVPEHTVSLFNSLLRIRIKHFPALFVLANMLSGPLLGTDTATWLALFGFLTGWLYLRFYRISDIGANESATGGEGSSMKGDPSETFAFVSFFPDIFHPVLAPVCDSVYDVLVQMKLCVPFSDSDIEAATENAASRSEGGLPSIMNQGGRGGKSAEAERRRALALKALDQRLNAAAASRSANTSEAAQEGVPGAVEGNATKATDAAQA